MLAGGAHHALPTAAPGEEEVIERQRRERGADGGAAGNDGDLVLGEGLGDQRRQGSLVARVSSDGLIIARLPAASAVASGAARARRGSSTEPRCR